MPDVTSAIVASMSPFRIIVDFTADDLALFNTWANDQFSDEDPGLSATQGGRAVACLVCHFIEEKRLNSGMNSESLGGYAYSRAVAGKTGWLLAYEGMLAKWNVDAPTQGVQRNDMDMPAAFRTSNQKVAKLLKTDTTLKTP